MFLNHLSVWNYSHFLGPVCVNKALQFYRNVACMFQKYLQGTSLVSETEC